MPTVLASGQELDEQVDLLIDGCQVGSTGDIAAGHIVAVYHACGDIVGNGSADDRDLGSGSSSRLQGSSGVGHDQIHLVVDELGSDGSAVGGLVLSILVVEFDAVFSQQVNERLLEALGRRIQRLMLQLLKDAYLIDFLSRCFGLGRWAQSSARFPFCSLP